MQLRSRADAGPPPRPARAWGAPVQVGQLDRIVVNEAQAPHARGRQVQGRRRTQTAAADNGHPRLAEAGLSLHLRVQGENTHHQVEACFKAVARALRKAIRRQGRDLPSTKGTL